MASVKANALRKDSKGRKHTIFFSLLIYSFAFIFVVVWSILDLSDCRYYSKK